MIHRQGPVVVRLRNGVRGTVRNTLETLRSLGSPGSASGLPPGRSSRSQTRAGGSRIGSRDDARRGRSTEPSASAALVDPETGPTSRSEILEYGCLPATYVRAVLTEHGGRVKQRRFVDEYGWSPATVSRLLSELEREGAIGRYKIGRENVVCLPDENERSARSATDLRKNHGDRSGGLEAE